MQVDKKLQGKACETGYEVLGEHGCAILWMSVGNPYFTEEKIKELVTFCAGNFSQLQILVPQGPAVHTYRALGYDETGAEKKARLMCNALINKARKAIDQIPEQGCDIHITDWDKEILPDSDYTTSLQAIRELYLRNEAFREACDKATEEVIKNRTEPVDDHDSMPDGSRVKVSMSGRIIDLQEAVKTGVGYILEELAFIIASPEIFQVPKTAYLYHKEWEIYQNLVNGAYGPALGNLGFLKLS